MNDERSFNIPLWSIENTHPNLVDALEEELTEIIDPELALNIIQLGLVRDIEVQDDHAVVTMILTTPFCPYGPSMMEGTRQKVEEVIMMPTKIKYGRETWDPTMMEEGLANDWGLY